MSDVDGYGTDNVPGGWVSPAPMVVTEVFVRNGRVVLQVEGERVFWLDLNPTDAADLAARLLHCAAEVEHG